MAQYLKSGPDRTLDRPWTNNRHRWDKLDILTDQMGHLVDASYTLSGTVAHLAEKTLQA
jgi:hypothetical protein